MRLHFHRVPQYSQLDDGEREGNEVVGRTFPIVAHPWIRVPNRELGSVAMILLALHAQETWLVPFTFMDV